MKERLLFQYKSEDVVQHSLETVHAVYSRIVDEQSREIYRDRLLMTFTGDVSYIREMVLITDVGRKLQDFLMRQKKIYIYGAGIRGQRIVHMFPEANWIGYIDQKKEGLCNGLEIINPEKMEIEEDAIVLITNLEGFDEIKQFLAESGLAENAIYTLNDFEVQARKKQYFEDRCIKNFKDTQGVFLDAGCFDGGDCIKFSESILNHNTAIYAFEPDEINYINCKKILSVYDNVKVFNIGLSDVKKQECFMSDKGACSRITTNGNCLINIETIDSVMQGQKIGFIKMDIEGCEKKALSGARMHIRNDKPNLMISIYHKLEDVIEIPKLLLELNPDYKFALGHYSVCNGDTVLYAF